MISLHQNRMKIEVPKVQEDEHMRRVGRDVLYAENPIGDDDWFYKHPDSMCFEAVYFNPDSTDGGQYVIMTLPYELISDAAERTDSAETFFAFLEERASSTELVDITDGNFRAVMESYKGRPADFIGRSAAVMLSLIKTVASEVDDPVLTACIKEIEAEKQIFMQRGNQS